MVAEQGNSSTSGVKTQMYYMNSHRAALFLLFFMVEFNKKKEKMMMTKIAANKKYAAKLRQIFQQKSQLELLYLQIPIPTEECMCIFCTEISKSIN
jgi:hypothetical protein